MFVGIDGCFKLKLKDRGFGGPDLSAGLAYMVKEDQYQTYLAANADINEPVGSIISSIDSSLIATI